MQIWRTYHVEPGEFIHLSVSDTGPGITPEMLHKIFDPYFTTKEQGKGKGMGLAIVDGVVSKYGGYIRCISEVVPDGLLLVFDEN